MARSKREPEYGIVGPFPKVLYKFDRTMVQVTSEAALQKLLAENDKPEAHGQHKGEPVWAESPAAFGVETAPAAPAPENRVDRW